MPYTYFRKKIFRKYVLIFTFFYMIGRRFCSSSVSELVFQGVPFWPGYSLQVLVTLWAFPCYPKRSTLRLCRKRGMMISS